MIKDAVTIPVLSTGGWQTASSVRDALGHIDGVSMARALVANPDLPQIWAAGHDLPPAPCTHCNKCLVGAPKLPMGCHELERFPSRDAMIDQLMEVYDTKAELQIPEAS